MSKKSAFRNANDEVIKKAFVRLMASKDESIKAAMYGMLEDAVIVALEMHDERHPGHVEIGDTYGWMLVHNHRIQEIMVVSTDANRGEATDLLREHLKALPATGWVGVVMAGMAKPSYFSVRYETKILTQTARITKENFFQYFKAI